MLADRAPLLEIARGYVTAGLSVIPVRADGSKAAAVKWAEFEGRFPTADELAGWFTAGRPVGVAVVCGKVSGNLAVLDFESNAAWERWHQRAAETGALGWGTGCPLVRTPKGGRHLYCRIEEGWVAGGKLAMASKNETVVEVRGEGHYVLAPGCPAACHPLNVPYQFEFDGWLSAGDAPGTVTIEQFTALCDLAREQNEYAPPERVRVAAPAPSDAKGDRPGDQFNRRANWSEVLEPHGWTVDRTSGEVTYWTRPGKDRGVSATTGRCRSEASGDLLYVFSSNAAPFEPQHAYDKFGALTHLNHAGDFAAAAKGLAARGYGSQQPNVKFTTGTPPGTSAGASAVLFEVSPTDDSSQGLARHVLANYAHPIRPTIVFWSDKPHEWNGSSYKTLTDDGFLSDVNRLAHKAAESVYQAKWAKWRSENPEPANEVDEKRKKTKEPTQRDVTSSLARSVRDAIHGLCAVKGVDDAPAWIGEPGPDPLELVATPGGLVHLPKYAARETGAIIPNTPNYFNFNATTFSPDPDAPQPDRWWRFLADVWSDEAESIGLLQEWFGYLLTADTRQHKILMLQGPPRSGKGTILRVLEALLGKSCCCAVTLESLGTRFGIGDLMGKSVAIAADARLSKWTDSKALVNNLLSLSGEDSLRQERKGVDAVSARLRTRLIISTNLLPELEDSSGAILSRLSILKFTKTFLGKEDHQLTDKLLAELPGIFNWAVEGLARLRQSGRFCEPAASKNTHQAMAAICNPMQQFRDDCCVLGADFTVERQALYQAWCHWCARHGIREPGTDAKFGAELQHIVKGLEDTRPRVNGKRLRHYKGLRLREVADDWSQCPADGYSSPNEEYETEANAA